jgi:hypothetical protein
MSHGGLLPQLVLTLLLAAMQASLSLATPPHAAPGFLSNVGQTDSAAEFYSIGSDFAAYLTRQGPVLELRSFQASGPDISQRLASPPSRDRETRLPGITRRVAVGVRFLGASGPVRIEPVGDAVGQRNYLLGSRARGGSTRAPRFRQVAYREVWPGIDILYSADESGLVYEMVTKAGADLSKVRFAYEGARVTESSRSRVVLETSLGSIEDQRPGFEGQVGWLRGSVAGATQQPDAGTSLEAAATESVSSVNSLAWGTFLGGSLDEAVYAMVVDSLGRPIVTGTTRSADFPTTLGVVDTTYEASFDVFVAQLSADGSQLLWSTYLGGGGDDRAWAITLDGAGNPVVAGVSSGDGFPTTTGAFQESANGEYDAFVLKLAADGSALIWSTLYGGGAREWDVSGVALDALGRPVLTGSTRSEDLPTSAGALDSSLGGPADAFVARFSADGTALDYGTYLGGADWDGGEDVAVAPSGAAIVVGETSSDDFPATADSFQPSRMVPTQDAFVARLAPDGTSLEFATYLGGGGQDVAYSVILDDLGEVIVSGRTGSPDFPTTPGTVFPVPLGGDDAFVSQLHSAGGALTWSTYWGGTGSDRALDLVRNGWGGLSMVGWSCSEDLPVTPGALASAPLGPCEGYLALLAADGSRADHGSYVGGWRDETVFAVAVDAADRQMVAGETWSTNFPVSAGSYSPDHNSPNQYEDGFVAAVDVAAFCTELQPAAGTLDLTMALAVDGRCPAGPVNPNPADLVEGKLEALSAADIGTVQCIRGATPDRIIPSIARPALGAGLFLVARELPAGAYTDGGGPGLIGARLPISGDCP